MRLGYSGFERGVSGIINHSEDHVTELRTILHQQALRSSLAPRALKRSPIDSFTSDLF